MIVEEELGRVGGVVSTAAQQGDFCKWTLLSEHTPIPPSSAAESLELLRLDFLLEDGAAVEDVDVVEDADWKDSLSVNMWLACDMVW